MKLLNSLGRGLGIALLLVCSLAASFTRAQNGPIVFVIVMENKNWLGSGGIDGSTQAPYINKTLVPMAATAQNYFNPPSNHPSLPNYIWMEAGSNLGVHNDGSPSEFSQSTTKHLSRLLSNSGIVWKAYEESITTGTCPLQPEGSKDAQGSNLYQPRHYPQIYFKDMTSSNSSTSAYCIGHTRPFSSLASDLKAGTIGRYNFITPNMCDNGHDSCGGNEVAHIDAWMKANMPTILNSAQYKAGKVTIFITADEAENGDGPIPFLALGQNVKKGYSNQIRYTHSSLLRTLEEIFKVTPLLGGAATATDLKDLFTALP